MFKRLQLLTLLIFSLSLNALPAIAQTLPPSRPILFVHGWCGSPYDWAPLFDPFSQALPSSMYPNQAVYLVQYNSVANTISFWTEDDPSAGPNTTLTPIAEDMISSDARFFALQFIDPNPTSTDPTDPANVAAISVLNKAYEISQVVKHIVLITQIQQVNILSHSMGGLDARAYVENMASAGACYDYANSTPDYTAPTCSPGTGLAAWAGDVANIITLDTPNTGSSLADSKLRTLAGIDGYQCEADTTTNSVEITSASKLLDALNYSGSELADTSPRTLGTPVQAIEDYISNVTKSWTGLSGYSDDIVQLPSQSITQNIPAADATATLTDLPFPYLSATITSTSGCTVSLLGIKKPLMHFLSCLGALQPTQDAVENQLINDSVPWITSWNVTPATQTLGSNFTIGYSAMDLSAYTLSRAELWRAPDVNGVPGTWNEVGSPQTLSGNGPTQVTFTDTPAAAGKYWYGTHLFDSGGNEAIEPSPTQVTLIAPYTPAVTVMPSTYSITTAQALPVKVTVSGGNSNPTPTGSVTLSGGGYTSAAATLSGGSVTINIPAGSLAAGSDTLTASYAPDTASNTIYNSATGISLAVMVTAVPAATPTFSPAAGTYTSTQTVTIADTTAGATIYYTSNGTTPTTNSTKYTAAIPVSLTETIEAIAVATGYTTSTVTTAKYTITLPAATPTFSPAAGTYTAKQTVTISDTTAGATIYYTSNGTTPTTNSTKYTAAIPISSTETIEAIAVATGYTNSAVAVAKYTIL